MEMPMRDSDADSSSTRDGAGPAPVGDWSLSVKPRLSPDGGDSVSGAADGTGAIALVPRVSAKFGKFRPRGGLSSSLG